MAAVTLGAVVSKVAKTLVTETAKDPGKAGKVFCGITIGICSGVVVITTLLSGTVSSFFGETLSVNGAEVFAATTTANTDIASYMTEIMESAAKTKEEIIGKNKVTTTFFFEAEEYTSLLDITNRANNLKEEYSRDPYVVECSVQTGTTGKTYYTITGITPGGTSFTEDKVFASEEEVDEYVSAKSQLGCKNLTSSKPKKVYSANFQVDVITCDFEIEEKWEKIPTSYVLAYLSTQTLESEKIQNPALENDVILNFLSIASPLKTKREEKKISFWNETMSPEALALELWPSDEQKRSFFLASQQSYESMLREKNKVYIDFDFVNVKLEIPNYYQNNYKNVKYGNGTIASAGCGPVCIAMLTTYLTGSVETPPEVCKWCEEDYYISGEGTSWRVFEAAAEHYGYTCVDMGLDYEAILTEIADGYPVVASMGPGTFTSEGHYILIVGMTSAGELIINDPNENNVKQYGTDKFSSETVLGEAKNFWVFGK